MHVIPLSCCSILPITHPCRNHIVQRRGHLRPTWCCSVDGTSTRRESAQHTASTAVHHIHTWDSEERHGWMLESGSIRSRVSCSAQLSGLPVFAARPAFACLLCPRLRQNWWRTSPLLRSLARGDRTFAGSQMGEVKRRGKAQLWLVRKRKEIVNTPRGSHERGWQISR